MKLFVCPGFNAVFLFFCLTCFFQLSTQTEEEDLAKAYQNFTSDYQVLFRFLEAQFFPATEWDPIPVFEWLQPPGTAVYKIKRCKRADVMNCTRAGNPKLPKEFQGAYWQEGLQWDEELANSFGPWNEKERHLTIELWQPKNWGAHDTSSRIAPGQWYWLPSGASHLNFLSTMQVACDVFLSEDNQSAQILLSAVFLGILRVSLPSWLLDWPMKREPDGSWARKGSLLGIPMSVATYVLRPVVTGDLKPAKYYPQWLKAWGGRDFFYLDKP